MKIFTKTIEEIEAFSTFDEQLEWFPIYNQKTMEEIPNAWFHFIGHFFADGCEDEFRLHFEFDFISLN